MDGKLVAAVVVGGAILLAPTYGYSQDAGGEGGGCTLRDYLRNVPQCAPAPTLGAMSLRLERGMTENEVETFQTLPPNGATLDTCGQHTQSGDWTCKIWDYTDGTNVLEVFFQQDNKGVWRVNNWDYNS